MPRFAATLTVVSGTFASQPLAFAAILDAADEAGISVDLADVDVIRHAAPVRLAHYFRPAIVARIEALKGEDDTVIILRPGEATQSPGFPARHPKLRRLGVFAGTLVEPPEPE